MVNSWDDNNYSSSKLEQSLRKIITQLEQSLDAINKSSSLQEEVSLPKMDLMRNLERNSELLLRSLSENNQGISFPPEKSSRSLQSINEFDYSKARRKDDQNYYSAQVSKNHFNSDKSSARKFNFTLAIALIISLLFNVCTFFWTGNVTTVETINTNQETSTLLNNSENQTSEKLLETSPEIVAPTPEITNQPTPKTIEPEDNLIPQIPPHKTSVEVRETELGDSYQMESGKENNLLNIIKNKLQIVTDNYQENLIVKVVPQYENNSILIIVNDNWQLLELDQRKQLSQKLFERTKSIDFYRFQLKDIHNNLLARNSVLGDNLIFYQ